MPIGGKEFCMLTIIFYVAVIWVTLKLLALLVQAGYSGEIIQRIKAIRYLKSKSNAIIRLLYVTKLI